VPLGRCFANFELQHDDTAGDEKNRVRPKSHPWDLEFEAYPARPSAQPLLQQGDLLPPRIALLELDATVAVVRQLPNNFSSE
jgi:hypothetical protein